MKKISFIAYIYAVLCRMLFSYCYNYHLHISKKFSLGGREGYEIPMDRKMYGNLQSLLAVSDLQFYRID